MPKSKYYKLLGLNPYASEKEVRKKYRQLVMQYHPDKNPHPGAEEMFIKLTEAYDVLLGKQSIKYAPSVGKTEDQIKKDKEARMKMARERYAEQVLKEKLEDERYYRFLTSGRKWWTIRLMAIMGVIFSILLILDLFLPHHYEEDEVTEFHRSVAYSPDRRLVSLIKTERGDYYWVSQMTYSLYAETRKIYVESSWVFHNPIRLVLREKLNYTYFEIHFTVYKSLAWIIIIFLLPLATVIYKRKKISFTFLFYLCYYGVSAAMLIFLFTGGRWAHFLTLGFA